MVNVPTAVWIDEKGRIVRPNEVAYVDNRYKGMHGIEASEYLDALRDWAANGERSVFALSEKQLEETPRASNPDGRWRRPSSLWQNIFIALVKAKPRSGITKRPSGSTPKAGTTNARRGRSRTPNAITGRAL